MAFIFRSIEFRVFKETRFKKCHFVVYVDEFIHSPEIESKWVGESEKNLRDIFADAQADYDNRWRQAPPLHIVIFDEIDAITRERGTQL